MTPLNIGVTQLFQSTLSMRRATGLQVWCLNHSGISIHALHEESDVATAQSSSRGLVFQSTLSMRRATRRYRRRRAGFRISIHALHEESDHQAHSLRQPSGKISIHALHEESDAVGRHRCFGGRHISIHALHEESDPTMPYATNSEIFQSTLSMRRATRMPYSLHGPDSFQSTLSMRRATKLIFSALRLNHISIHALHEESDLTLSTKLTHSLKFQSTLSMRRATASPTTSKQTQEFQSTLSMRRATGAS